MTDEKTTMERNAYDPWDLRRIPGLNLMEYAKEVDRGGKKDLELSLEGRKIWFRLVCPGGGLALNALRVTDAIIQDIVQFPVLPHRIAGIPETVFLIKFLPPYSLLQVGYRSAGFDRFRVQDNRFRCVCRDPAQNLRTISSGAQLVVRHKVKYQRGASVSDQIGQSAENVPVVERPKIHVLSPRHQEQDTDGQTLPPWERAVVYSCYFRIALHPRGDRPDLQLH